MEWNVLKFRRPKTSMKEPDADKRELFPSWETSLFIGMRIFLIFGSRMIFNDNKTVQMILEGNESLDCR